MYVNFIQSFKPEYVYWVIKFFVVNYCLRSDKKKWVFLFNVIYHIMYITLNKIINIYFKITSKDS
jgi:hypothetical protein